MTNMNDRMEQLVKAGIDTGKYFAATLKDGTTIHLIIDEKTGNCKQVEDPVKDQIICDGYVLNTKLYRRFVMAQMFRMLNFDSYCGYGRGYTDALNFYYGYEYTFKMMLEEARVLGKLETRDTEAFKERSHFFTKTVIASVVEDYVQKAMDYIATLPERKCKGVPYKRINGKDIFVSDLRKKIARPAQTAAARIRCAKSYDEVYYILLRFMKGDMIKLPYFTTKSKDWVDAFKGNGAYYTCKNLIMYHGCKAKARWGWHSRDESLAVLSANLETYKGEGWRMFGFMKQLISDNHFDFNKRMTEIYGK